jgi:Rieske Fe-S protein
MTEDSPVEETGEGEGFEGNISRRYFLKFLLGTSIILSVTPFVPMVKFFFAKQTEKEPGRKLIGNTKELTEGSTKVFFYPGEESEHRSFLHRLPLDQLARAREEGRDRFINDGFVAFNTICPHLQCPIELPEGGEYVCPCHGGVLDVTDGTVKDGPIPRPLPAIRLEIDGANGDIYAVELIGRIGYGRE